MLAYILISAAALIVLFVVIVATRPSDFRVSRSAEMSATPIAAFEQVNDFHNWDNWSPWAKLDPNCKNTFEGPSSGRGARFSWSGNNKIGAGRMTITDSRPGEFVGINLEFLRPFKATNTAEFTFEPQGNQTLVTWSMLGKKNFVMKAFGLFMSCDDMLGKQFDKGLASMKTIVEAALKSSPRELQTA
jgi:hypothetical protein